MSLRVDQGVRVTLSYTLKTERGDVLEDRTPENPFVFIYGTDATLPAIESVILGKTEGFEASLGIDAPQAYGEFDDHLVATVPRSQFPSSIDLQVGMKFATHGPDGSKVTVRIVEVLEDKVTIDGNHPLAGLSIAIDLKILRIEKPGPDEELGFGIGDDAKPSSGGKRTLH